MFSQLSDMFLLHLRISNFNLNSLSNFLGKFNLIFWSLNGFWDRRKLESLWKLPLKFNNILDSSSKDYKKEMNDEGIIWKMKQNYVINLVRILSLTVVLLLLSSQSFSIKSKIYEKQKQQKSEFESRKGKAPQYWRTKNERQNSKIFLKALFCCLISMWMDNNEIILFISTKNQKINPNGNEQNSGLK